MNESERMFAFSAATIAESIEIPAAFGIVSADAHEVGFNAIRPVHPRARMRSTDGTRAD